MTDPAECCFNCRYWELGPHSRSHDDEACLRHAPTAENRLTFPNSYYGKPAPVWPTTRGTDWCGDWAKLPPPSPVGVLKDG